MKRLLLIPCGLVLLLFLTAVSGCFNQGKASQTPGVITSKFATYEEVEVNATPAVKPYKVDRDLGNITNKDMFRLSPAATDLLIKNGFVVVPTSYEKEFFSLYERNRYEPVPLFVTTDSVLHNYHLFFDHLLRVVETERLAPELKELNKAMLAQAQKQYEALKDTDWENAARRNIGFFAVAGKLLDPGVPAPVVVKSEVENELALIENHQGIAVSPLMNIGVSGDSGDLLREDYSQYIPRGHYERTDLLKAYFKSMMWYGRLTFRVTNEYETKSAVLITLALNQGENSRMWDRIYATTNFFVGKSDDIAYDQLKELVERIYGTDAGLQTVVDGPEKWNEFLAAAGELEPPSINSMPVIDATSPAEREKESKGFRFMGQRFTLDASVFQRLLYPEVMENSQGEMRVLPRGMDIPAAMGSAQAYDILESTGETDYRNYQENMAKMKAYTADLSKETWTENLYWNWLYTLMPLTWEKPAGYPSFMRNQAWERKDLNTYLGSWVELKHDTILYAKPVYAEAGGGGEIIDDRGYVEPNPDVYARLASLVNMTAGGLQARGLLNDRDKESLERMEELILALKTISEKELSNTPLTDEEYDLIRSYGGQLEHFWLEALRDEGIDHRSAIFDRPAALVADVATNPGGGQVLEEATGNVFEIYAVVPVDGKLRIAIGGVYSYYEFPWSLNDRLTDSKWHKMINDGQAPPLPGWTSDFIAQ
ncbi:hypothetical protein Psch_01277 [Pelotomaculum schinkii]|uniref:DUF3160 domain-containing protein n=1 Tax=Pelotomaculum schinkii TaxID=78350 RepID=A0A4Y7RGA1_9FIRM|nr:DUF3160 domain-containing protein [Pelotomaculum schinkii]TEB07722.1 hypothetical protein Psch_01277 [Pelotomaculum schinkii]